MVTRIGINGFGRIGRQVTRAIIELYPEKLEAAAVNDLADAKTNAHLFKYDTNYGKYPGTVEARDSSLIIDGKEIRVFSERDPASIPWAELGVELVVESTGIFTDAEKAVAHIKGGAKKVIISAPARNEDITLVLGVNDNRYDPGQHNIVFQRFLYHELFRTHGQGASRLLRAPARTDVHDPFLHQRPEKYWTRYTKTCGAPGPRRPTSFPPPPGRLGLWA